MNGRTTPRRALPLMSSTDSPTPHPVWNPEPVQRAKEHRALLGHRRKLLARLASRLPTGPFRMLPDLVILGAAKSGTTTLHAYLVQSPHISWALRKETFFFTRTYHWGLSWYRAFFELQSVRRRAERAGRGPLLCGEGTPDYLLHPHAPKRLKATIPNAKLIVILRNPVDRAYSLYKHQVQRVNEPLTFAEAVDAEADRLDGELERMLADERYHSIHRQDHSYLARGCYMDQLDGWLALFPREQFLILLMDDLAREPERTIRQLTDFLEIPPLDNEGVKKANESIVIEPMEKEVRARLTEYFRPHNARLEEFLGRPLDWDR